MSNDRFWMIKGSGPSTAVHSTRRKAEEEASRLAASNPGTPFTVMEAVAVFESKGVERRNLGTSDRDLARRMEEIVQKTTSHSIAGTIAREALGTVASDDPPF